MPPQLLYDISGIDLNRVLFDQEVIRQFNPQRGSPLAWMATIARNCALDETRRAASRPTEDDAALHALPSDCNPRISDEATDDARRLRAALERLDPEKRALVVRAYCLGLTREEIARATGRPTSPRRRASSPSRSTSASARASAPPAACSARTWTSSSSTTGR